MKTYGGSGYVHVFLISTPVGGEWSVSRPCRLTTRGKSPRYPLNKRLWIGPRAVYVIEICAEMF
jgi:hypothetical protein